MTKICYGEPHKIAMDHAIRKGATHMQKIAFALDGLPRKTVDADTALEDGQWEKLKNFLGDKLPPEHMETVEDICRGGGDAPKPGEDRKRSSGAADSKALLARHEANLRGRHKLGLISEADLVNGLRFGSDLLSSKTAAVAYDAKVFPNKGRLK